MRDLMDDDTGMERVAFLYCAQIGRPDAFPWLTAMRDTLLENETLDEQQQLFFLQRCLPTTPLRLEMEVFDWCGCLLVYPTSFLLLLSPTPCAGTPPTGRDWRRRLHPTRASSSH